jgi:hypothetical protein
LRQLEFKAGISRIDVRLAVLEQRSPAIDVLLKMYGAMGVSAGEFIERIEGNTTCERRRR